MGLAASVSIEYVQFVGWAEGGERNSVQYSDFSLKTDIVRWFENRCPYKIVGFAA